MREVENVFYRHPAMTAFPEPINKLTDAEYLSLALKIQVRCRVDMKKEERDDSYRIDIYFAGTVFEGEYVDDLMHLMRASEMYTFSVMKKQPETIRLTCYRTKR